MSKLISGFKLCIACLVLASCADSTDGSKENSESVQMNEAISTTVAPEGKVAEVYISADDRMRFNKEEIIVREGQQVILTLIHSGSMPKTSMGHNFVLLKNGTDLAEFGRKAALEKSNDYIPESEVDNIIANTKMLGGGERDTISFTAPEKGTYEYLCSFPGHYSMMKGKFIVQ